MICFNDNVFNDNVFNDNVYYNVFEMSLSVWISLR